MGELYDLPLNGPNNGEELSNVVLDEVLSNSVQAANILNDRFQSIDSDKDGFLSSKELLQSISRSQFGSAEYKSLYAFQRNIGKVEELRDDEWGDENDGISRKDIKAFSSLNRNDPLKRAVEAVVSSSSAFIPNLTIENSDAIAAAKSIRQATKKDDLVDLGTDEDAIFATLESLSDDERLKLKEFYSKEYSIELVDELRSELDAEELERALNLLGRKDGQSDDAGFLHELLGKDAMPTRQGALDKGLRDKLSSMSSSELDRARADYRQRYGKELDAALLAGRTFNRQPMEIYLKGSDRRTDEDTMRLATLAFHRRDIEMFQEAMRSATPEARKNFSISDGARKVREAFGRTIGDTDLNRAKDMVEHGKLSAPTLVKASTSWVGDSEKSIEKALEQMSDTERQLFVRGETLSLEKDRAKGSFWNQPALTSEERKAVDYYRELCKALEGAGNATEVAMWKDQAQFKDGSIVTALGRHRGTISSSPMDDVLGTIERMSQSDWRQLKDEPTFRDSMAHILGTFLSKSELTRATELIDRFKQFDSLEGARLDGRRSILDCIKDNENRGVLWLDTKEENILKSIENMPVSEQKKYRENIYFKVEVDKALDRSLGTSVESEVARCLLRQIERAEAPRRTIADRVALDGAEMVVDKAKVVREVQKEFFENPELFERVRHPKNSEDERFATRLEKNLLSALGHSNFENYGRQLLEVGFVSPDDHVSLNSSILNVDEKGLIESLQTISPRDKALLNARALPSSRAIDDLLTTDENKLARVQLVQKGERRVEDRLRAYVLGVGESKAEIQGMLANLTVSEKRCMTSEYSRKYESNAAGDFLSKLDKRERVGAGLLIESREKTSQDALSDGIRSYSDSRWGVGKEWVDGIWDGSGLQANDALDQLVKAVSDNHANPEVLREKREALTTSLENYQASEERLAEVATELAIGLAAVGGAFFTAGSSTATWLSRMAYMGAETAFLKVGGKATIMGADYDCGVGQLTSDATRGFAAGAISTIGAAQVGAWLGIGEKTGTEATRQALSKLVAGGLIENGQERVVEQGLVEMARRAIISGTMRVPADAVASLSSRVATKGSERAVESLLRTSLSASLQTQASHVVANLAAEYGVTAASGALSGGSSGLVLSSTEWDSDKSVGENLEQITRTTVTFAALGGASASTIKGLINLTGKGYLGAKDYLANRSQKQLPKETIDELQQLMSRVNKDLRQYSDAIDAVNRSDNPPTTLGELLERLKSKGLNVPDLGDRGVKPLGLAPASAEVSLPVQKAEQAIESASASSQHRGNLRHIGIPEGNSYKWIVDSSGGRWMEAESAVARLQELPARTGDILKNALVKGAGENNTTLVRYALEKLQHGSEIVEFARLLESQHSTATAMDCIRHGVQKRMVSEGTERLWNEALDELMKK